ncbi:MAG: TrkH family potassium uptake protein [Methanospirillaceae archaeon]|nr:TrkH family potassium uptake protein [Methanospirillaceae archaeon]
MKGLGHTRLIAHETGEIFFLVGLVTILPVLIAAIYQEWDIIVAMATVPAILILSAIILTRIPYEEMNRPKISVALVAVAVTWFVVALIASVPFHLGLGMPISDSVFEAMSGWTGTGLSLLPSPDNTPHAILFFRSYMQWIGGIGIMALGITMQQRSSISQNRLFRIEGRDEAIMPNVISTAKSLWKLYTTLTILFIGLILLTGVPVFDAVNLVMSGIATGGFSVHDAGVSYYDSLMLEILLIPVMIVGCLPFKLYFFVLRGEPAKLFRNTIVKTLLFLIVIGSVITTCDLYLFNHLSLSESLRQGIFCTVAGVTNTGYQNSDIGSWIAGSVVLITILMMMSGSVGSTAGGIKVNRFVLAAEGMVWWFKRFFIKPGMLSGFKHEGKIISKNISQLELTYNLLRIILYLIMIFTAAFLALSLYYPDTGLYKIVFEMVSAASGVGLSVGYITSESPEGLKWIFILLMWIGRMEILPVIILVLALARGFEYKR